MNPDERRDGSLADQAAAWVPPWARQPADPAEPTDVGTPPAPRAPADEPPPTEPVADAPDDETRADEPPVAEAPDGEQLPGDPADEPVPAEAVAEARTDEALVAEAPVAVVGEPLPGESADELVLAEAVAEARADEPPVAEPPVAEPPVADAGAPVAEAPLPSNAGVDQPRPGEPAVQPTAGEPTAGEPSTAGPLAPPEPVDEEPGVVPAPEEPADEQPADEQPADEQPAEPVVAEPTDLAAVAATAPPSPQRGAVARIQEESEGPAALALIDEDELRGALEAILLVVDEPVSEIVLAQVLEQPTERIGGQLAALAASYTEAGHGFDLRRAAGGWRLYTRPEYAPYVERFVLDGQQVRLTQAALETVAVVAYKQPVTRSRISAIRGVNCDGVVRTLVSRGLIEECGTEPESGAYLYRTTILFLEKLGLDSVDQLPPLAPFLPEDVDEVADAQR